MRFIDFIEKTRSVDKRYLTGEKGQKLLNFLETGIPLDDLVSGHRELLEKIPLPQIKRLSDSRRAWQELEKSRENLIKTYEGDLNDLTDEVFSVAITAKRMEALAHIIRHIPKSDFQSVEQWVNALNAALEVWTGAVNLTVKKGEMTLVPVESAQIPAKFEHLLGKHITLSSMSKELWTDIRQMERMGLVKPEFSYHTMSIMSHLQKVSPRMGQRIASMDPEVLLQDLILSGLPEAIKQFFDHKIREEILKFLAARYHDVLKNPPITAPRLGAFYPGEDSGIAGLAVLSDKGKLLAYENIELAEGWNNAVRVFFVKHRTHYVAVPLETSENSSVHQLRKTEGDFLAVISVRSLGIDEAVSNLSSVPEDATAEIQKSIVIVRRLLNPMKEWGGIDPYNAVPPEFFDDVDNNLVDEDTIRMYLREFRGMAFMDPGFAKIQPRVLPTPPPAALLNERLNPNVRGIDDVTVGQKLKGVIINITKFGAFVNIGLAQEALIHVSEMTDHFINDPHDIVGLGDKVEATVVSVDLEKNRISLSLLENPTLHEGPPKYKDSNKTKRGEKYQSPAARSQALRDLENLFKK